MKLTVLQENLSKAITLASRFASTRTQLPVLGNILIKADKTKVKIGSTNLEISVSTTIGAKIEEDGEISIPARVIGDIVNNLPKESVLMETDKEQLKITSSGFSAKILGMNTNDFPKIPVSISKEKSIDLSVKNLLESLSKVSFAVSSDETRPVLTGVLFILTNTKLTLVATDGFRLSRKALNIKTGKDLRVIVPKNVLGELSRMSSGDDLSFAIEEKEKQIIFGAGDTVLTSRVLEGAYPDYEKIIPKKSDIKLRVDREEFLRSVKLASVFARDAANIVKLKLGKDALAVAAESSSSGSQETKIDSKVDGDVPKDFQISFNYRFLEEFLQSVTGEEVTMEFTTPLAAGVFLDSSDNDYLHLIMPVRVQD